MPAVTAVGVFTNADVELDVTCHSNIPPAVLTDAGCVVTKLAVVIGQTLATVVAPLGVATLITSIEIHEDSPPYVVQLASLGAEQRRNHVLVVILPAVGV